MARPALLLALLVAFPAILCGQADSGGPGVRFRLPGALQPLRIPAAHRLAAGALGMGGAAGDVVWAQGVRQSIDTLRRADAESRLFREIYGRPEAAPAAEAGGLIGLGRRFVDLSIDGALGVELRTDRLKNHRCTPYELQNPASGCRGGFSAPRIDNELVLRAGGVVGQRLHINIDFDNKRDFNAINDIRIFYQGLEDEVVQRVEVGTVTFTPPPSRFVTAAIPAYSFGLNTRFEVGPVTIGALAASQKGSAVTERTYLVGAGTSQPQDRALRDLDLEQGRFFWVVDPTKVPGYPAVDILTVDGRTVADTVRPRELRVYRYRQTQQLQIGGIRARGFRPEPGYPSTGVLTWELLVPGQDYVLDPSRLWIALANRLDLLDNLAVSYVTVSEDTVGTFPATDDPLRADSLLLIAVPHQEEAAPTFRYEMRQIYRVAGTDLQRNSLEVDLTVNRSERPARASSGGASTYLAQLGLAIPTDPDLLDVENRVFPRSAARDPLASQVLRESYIIFPHLRPFADTDKLDPTELNQALYTTPGEILLTQGPASKFQFRLRYNAAAGGERNFIDLNAFQIRPGSERIVVNGRTLRHDVDYTVSYELGRVTFIDPDALFAAGQATVTARFEERGIFAVAPTTIYGLTTTYRVGEAGSLNLIGIYQQENTVFNRPPVGFEPTANLVGGVTGDFRFKPRWITEAMDRVVRGGTTAPSTFDLSAEVAFTAPQANRAGQAYLEEFEGEAGLAVNLRENGWGYGSRPESTDGLESITGLGASFDSADAVMVTWQNLVNNGSGQPVEVRTQDIDSLVRLTGGAVPLETVLYLTMHADTAGGFVSSRTSRPTWTQPRRDGAPRWRSIVTPLSATGADLTQSEFLEFWVFQGPSATATAAGVHLVLDIGSVPEDALAIAPESLTVTGSDSVWRGRRYAGVGRLDTERDPAGFFNAQTDDNGILIDRTDSLIVNGVPREDVSTCSRALGSTVQLFPWGDLSVRCTKGNGTMDTEDLNGDNVLDAVSTHDNVRRFVVELDDPKYIVRSGGTGWKLYRVPLRTPDKVIGSPNFRLVQHLRMTLVTPADGGIADVVGKFAVARMRFLGSPWVRRSETPVFGLSGSTPEAHGEVVVTTISTDNRELGYVPPPGVVDQAGRSDATGAGQINERSLRIIGRDLQSGERAEGYFRFLSGAQNLLKYRTLRLWVRGRGDGWNDDRLQAVFKAASDDRNFYAYRLNARTDTWGPEVVVDLEVWRRLRAEIENRYLQGLLPSGAATCGAGDSTAYVACSGNYLVQVADPAVNPPNLAAVKEISASVFYPAAGTAISDAELWVDDIRLVDPINAVGTATALSARITAADVGDINFSFVRQDGDFQQVGQDPTFQTSNTAQVTAGLRLDRFLPARLGIALPASVSYTRTTIDPTLVSGTDLRASDLPGLRKPEASQVSWGLSFRRTQRGRAWLTRALVDPTALNGSLTTGNSTSELSTATSASYSLGATYNVALPRRGPKLPLGGLANALPEWIEKSPVGTGMRSAFLALAPTSIRFGSGLSRAENSYTMYEVVVARSDDSLLRPTFNLAHSWRNNVGLTLQPFEMLTLDGNLISTRDLRRYSDSTSLGRVAAAERRDFLGMDVGVERERTLATTLRLTPKVASWFRPRYIRSSTFNLSRSLTSRDPIRADGDSGAFLLPQTYSLFGGTELGAAADLNRLVAKVAGDSALVTRVLRRTRPLDASIRHTRSSNFDLATFDPDLAFMLAHGGRDDFSAQGGDLAAYLAESDEGRIGGGADLPGGLTFTASWAEIETRRFSNLGGAFSETRTVQTEWPQGSARWNRPIGRGPLALITLGGNVRRREGTTVTPSGTGAARGRTVSGQLNPDMALSFRNGITLNVSYVHSDQINETTANRTEIVGETWNGVVSHSIRLPASMSARRRSVRASVNGQQYSNQTCLFLASNPEFGCRVVADLRRLTVSGGLSTEVLPNAEGAVNLQYVRNDIRHVDQLTTQLSIVVSLRMQLSSGDLR